MAWLIRRRASTICSSSESMGQANLEQELASSYRMRIYAGPDCPGKYEQTTYLAIAK